MGALWRKIPWTHWTFLIGALSLAGIPLFAGFFSKDAILGESFVLGWWPVFVIGAIVAALTGFYMFRLMGLTFYGKSRVDPEVEPKIHESPPSMVAPAGAAGHPDHLPGPGHRPAPGRLDHQALAGADLPPGARSSWASAFPEYELIGIDGGLIIISVAMAALGIGAAIWLFSVFNTRARLETVDSLTQRNRVSRSLYTASLNKWYFDDLNHLLFYRFGGVVANGVMWFDVKIIDGIVNGVGAVTTSVGDGVRHIQTGRVQNYALGIAIGLVVIATLLHADGPLMIDIGQLDILTLIIFTPLLGALAAAAGLPAAASVPRRGQRRASGRHDGAGRLLTAAVAFVLSLAAGAGLRQRGRPASSSCRRSTGSASSASSTRSASTASRWCWCCSRRC